jgi:hypothetical protein
MTDLPPDFAEAGRDGTMNHFTITRTDGVPTLLRKIAEAIERRGDVDVFDITFWMTYEGDEATMTVYYAPK